MATESNQGVHVESSTGSGAVEGRRAQLLSGIASAVSQRGRSPKSEKKTASPGDARRINNNTPISSTTIHGKGAIIFGSAFAGMGLFIILIATGVIPTDEGSANAPMWVVGFCGAIFAVPGLWLMLHGLVSLRVEARKRRVEAECPTQPWRADYPWSEQGIRDRQASGVRQMLFGMLFMIMFVTPFNYIAFESGSKGAMGYVFACVDGFAAVYAGMFFYRFSRWMKYGTGRVQFLRFPYFLGEQLNLNYIPARKLTGIQKLTCTVRCIREAYETHGTGDQRHESVVCYELYSDLKELDAAALSNSYDRAIGVQFDLPENGESTRIAERPPIYWELEVAAEARGVNLYSKFLLPVYSRAAGGDTPAPIPYSEEESALQGLIRDRKR